MFHSKGDLSLEQSVLVHESQSLDCAFYHYGVTDHLVTVKKAPMQRSENSRFLATRRSAKRACSSLTGIRTYPDIGSHHAKTSQFGNIGKDLPAYKLPFTAEGAAAQKYNVEHTVDSRSYLHRWRSGLATMASDSLSTAAG